jgi:hypothetical protein
MGAGKRSTNGKDGLNRHTGTPPVKMKEKHYDRELAKLHVELVKLQQWVVH